MFSACIGIVCRDQMSTSIYQIPLLLLVMLPSAMRGFNTFLDFLAEFTPISSMMTVYLNFAFGNLFCLESLKAVIVMLVWIALASGLFAWLYRKKGMDN